MRTLHAVILAGGPGRRFWPWSTAAAPKHALPLLPRGRTLFQETVARLRRLVPADRLWLVTTAPQAATLRRLAPALRRSRVLVEPEARDTAAALGTAAWRILREDPEAVMLACPADHVIAPAGRFAAQMHRAAALAAGGRWLVTFGARPDRPATAYGYLERGDRIPGTAFWRARAFREKPPEAVARRYLRSGRHLWNSGIFVWKAATFLEVLEAQAPALAAPLAELAPALGTPLQGREMARRYPRLPKVSVDYAVMESARDVAVAEADFAWTDWGTWTAWEASLRPDARGNRVFGRAAVSDCRDCTVVGADPRRRLEVAGAEGHLVVQAPAGLLVCRRGQAEDLKRLLERP